MVFSVRVNFQKKFKSLFQFFVFVFPSLKKLICTYFLTDFSLAALIKFVFRKRVKPNS